jgi:outer membrane biosynthesis protein TonB
MASRTTRIVMWVAAVHVAIVILLLVVPAVSRLFRKKPDMVIPIEFVVAVPPAPVPEPDPQPTPAKPKPKPVEPDPVPPKPKPKPRVRPKIERSTNLVTRTTSAKPPPAKPTPLPEEIARLLAAGAKPSDHTSVPGEDPRCLEMIRRALYAAWVQPSVSGAASLVAEATLELGAGGAVRSGRVSRSSGSAEFDASVEAALRSVSRVEGLTAGFLKRYPSVSIAFRVE